MEGQDREHVLLLLTLMGIVVGVFSLTDQHSLVKST